MTPHLRGHVRAYVDRALPPALLHVYDRHLVYCRVCQSAADQERRIVLSLRSDTGVPASLRSSLMGLAAAPPSLGTNALTRPSGPDGGPAVPPVPAAPPGSLVSLHAFHDPVPTVRPTAPALHRSPVRAAVVASIAAGASVAAAWGLAVVPLQGSARPASARVPSGSASLGSAAFGITSLAAAGFMVGSSSGSAASSQQARTSRRVAASSSTASYWVVAPQVYDGYDRPVVARVHVPLFPSAQSSP